MLKFVDYSENLDDYMADPQTKTLLDNCVTATGQKPEDVVNSAMTAYTKMQEILKNEPDISTPDLAVKMTDAVHKEWQTDPDNIGKFSDPKRESKMYQHLPTAAIGADEAYLDTLFVNETLKIAGREPISKEDFKKAYDEFAKTPDFEVSEPVKAAFENDPSKLYKVCEQAEAKGVPAETLDKVKSNFDLSYEPEDLMNGVGEPAKPEKPKPVLKSFDAVIDPKAKTGEAEAIISKNNHDTTISAKYDGKIHFNMSRSESASKTAENKPVFDDVKESIKQAQQAKTRSSKMQALEDLDKSPKPEKTQPISEKQASWVL